jgi:hypothetical protein
MEKFIEASAEIITTLALRELEINAQTKTSSWEEDEKQKQDRKKIIKHYEKCFGMISQYLMMPDGKKRDIHYVEMIDVLEKQLFEPEEVQSEKENQIDESIAILQNQIDELAEEKTEETKLRRRKEKAFKDFKAKARKEEKQQRIIAIKKGV